MLMQKLTALSKLKGKRIKNVGIVPRNGDLVFCTKKHAITFSADEQGLIQVNIVTRYSEIAVIQKTNQN